MKKLHEQLNTRLYCKHFLIILQFLNCYYILTSKTSKLAGSS